jgi:hypothetical protein
MGRGLTAVKGLQRCSSFAKDQEGDEERDSRTTQAKSGRLKTMMATLILWKIRASAFFGELYRTPDK